MVVGIQNLDCAVSLDICRSDFTRPSDLNLEASRVPRVRLKQNFLEVENDVGDVFQYARKGAEFVEGAIDLN